MIITNNLVLKTYFPGAMEALQRKVSEGEGGKAPSGLKPIHAATQGDRPRAINIVPIDLDRYFGEQREKSEYYRTSFHLSDAPYLTYDLSQYEDLSFKHCSFRGNDKALLVLGLKNLDMKLEGTSFYPCTIGLDKDYPLPKDDAIQCAELINKLATASSAPIKLDLRSRFDDSKALDVFLGKLTAKAATQITELNLSNSKLGSLPDSIASLKNLKKLSLSKCKLESLPSQIGKLINLQELQLSRNCIKEVPSQIKELRALKVLDLSDNQLKKIPAELCVLENLSSLFVLSNKITELPKEISRLKNLRFLQLGYNQIEDISALQSMSSLSSLMLCGNKIRELPLELATLTNLKALGIYRNQIEDIQVLCDLKNLEQLSLKHNLIKSTPNELASKLPLLKYLSLVGNPITDIEQEKAKLKDISYVGF